MAAAVRARRGLLNPREPAAPTLAYEQDFDAGPARVEFVLDTDRGYILQSTHWGMGEYDVPVAFAGVPDWQSRTVSTVSVVDAAP